MSLITMEIQKTAKRSIHQGNLNNHLSLQTLKHTFFMIDSFTIVGETDENHVTSSQRPHQPTILVTVPSEFSGP